ncbi:hypothetical protein Z043-107270 [Arapaima gigas]
MESRDKSVNLVNKNKVIDSTAKRKTNITRNNKENTKPFSESSKLQTTQDTQKMKGGLNTAVASKSSEKGEVLRKDRDTFKKTLDKKMANVGPAGPLTEMKRRTLSQTFLSQQAVQQKKLVAEVTKPHATMPHRVTLGSYKGRVVPSKINSFRKPVDECGEGAAKVVEKPVVSVADRLKKPGNMMREGTKSTAPVPRLELRKPSVPLPPQKTTVSNKLAQPVVRPAATSGAQQLLCSTRPPAAGSTIGVSSRLGSNKFPTILNRKGCQVPSGNLHEQAVANEKTKKLTTSSTVSQYWISKETAEERRAKLADWLASKGRSLKRPPIASTLSKTSKPVSKVQSKHQLNTQPVSGLESVSTTQLQSNLEPQVVVQPKSPVEPDAQPVSHPWHQPEQARAPSPDVMNTTVDLLDNSDMELPVDPEVRKDDLVVDLSRALEAMEVPSAESNQEETEENGEKECKVKHHKERKEACILEAKENGGQASCEQEDVFERKEVKQESSSEAESGDKVVEEAEMEAASVVRYSVRTTPYLQNMTRRIQGEATPSETTSRHHCSTIKDLKFLTPVRRSCRIQRQSARLPGMLTDHDPSVSSLAELAKMDDNKNAYIFRHNPALLETLPDQPGEAQC